MKPSRSFTVNSSYFWKTEHADYFKETTLRYEISGKPQFLHIYVLHTFQLVSVFLEHRSVTRWKCEVYVLHDGRSRAYRILHDDVSRTRARQLFNMSATVENPLDDSEPGTVWEFYTLTPCDPRFNHVPLLLGSSSSSAGHLEQASLVSAAKTLSTCRTCERASCPRRALDGASRNINTRPETLCDNNSF